MRTHLHCRLPFFINLIPCDMIELFTIFLENPKRELSELSELKLMN